MDTSTLAFMEFFIVAAVIIGWGVIELVGLRLDKRRREEDAREAERTARSKEPAADRKPPPP